MAVMTAHVREVCLALMGETRVLLDHLEGVHVGSQSNYIDLPINFLNLVSFTPDVHYKASFRRHFDELICNPKFFQGLNYSLLGLILLKTALSVFMDVAA